VKIQHTVTMALEILLLIFLVIIVCNKLEWYPEPLYFMFTDD
jgi:hypothetical protein